MRHKSAISADARQLAETRWAPPKHLDECRIRNESGFEPYLVANLGSLKFFRSSQPDGAQANASSFLPARRLRFIGETGACKRWHLQSLSVANW